MSVLIAALVFSGCGRKGPAEPEITHSVSTPDTPAGPENGHTGESLEYTTGGSACSRGHSVEYRFGWDDGTMSAWGEEVRTHRFETSGAYAVRAQARCGTKTGIESDWSGGRNVSITESTTGTMTGNDGKTYATIKIGNQWWMAENLKETRYRNGDVIPRVTDDSTWNGLFTGARCAYDNDENIAEIYGYLYNGYSVVDGRNLSPSDWRVPTEADWTKLADYIGGQLAAGGKMKEAGTIHWKSPNTGATNESGFAALPGGFRLLKDGSFGYLGYFAAFWSSTEAFAGYMWSRNLGYDRSAMFRDDSGRKSGFSVRLVREY